jgi:hypothetical protein
MAGCSPASIRIFWDGGMADGIDHTIEASPQDLADG